MMKKNTFKVINTLYKVKNSLLIYFYYWDLESNKYLL